MGADLLEVGAEPVGTKTAEVLSHGKTLKTAAKSVRRQCLRKQLSSGSKKKICEQGHSEKNCKTNQSVAKRHFDRYFSLTGLIKFRNQHFVAVFDNPRGKVHLVEDVLASQEQE